MLHDLGSPNGLRLSGARKRVRCSRGLGVRLHRKVVDRDDDVDINGRSSTCCRPVLPLSNGGQRLSSERVLGPPGDLEIAKSAIAADYALDDQHAKLVLGTVLSESRLNLLDQDWRFHFATDPVDDWSRYGLRSRSESEERKDDSGPAIVLAHALALPNA